MFQMKGEGIKIESSAVYPPGLGKWYKCKVRGKSRNLGRGTEIYMMKRNKKRKERDNTLLGKHRMNYMTSLCISKLR